MVFDEVKKNLAEIMSKDEDDITMETDLVNDLGVDSVDSVELIMALEETYDVSISDEDAAQLKTVGDVVEYVEKAIEA
jgi:acyl carrier protein